MVLVGTSLDWIVVSPSHTGPAGWGAGWEHLHDGGIEGVDLLILVSIAIGLGGYAATSQRWLRGSLLVGDSAISLAITILIMKDTLDPSLMVFLRLDLEGVKQVPGIGYYLTLIGELIVFTIGLDELYETDYKAYIVRGRAYIKK